MISNGFKLHLYGFLIAALFIYGCSPVQKLQSQHYPSDVAHALSGALILGHASTSQELPSLALSAITPEMAAFAEHAIRRGENNMDKVKLLHDALLLPIKAKGRGITYSAYLTQVPITTFETRQANCLSFSLLYVALAQHVGLKARINEVDIPPTWDLRNKNAMVFLRHVNVRIPLRSGEVVGAPNSDDVVIDLEMGRYNISYPQRHISDSLVAAQFYNNRGMEFASEGNFKDAFLNIRKALEEDNQQSYIWSNLASIYQRKNLLSEAEVVYLYGLKINPHDLSIINNLAVLYFKIGDKQQAAVFGKLAEHHRLTNPYYQYTLALSAFDLKDNENALRYIKRAINREKKEARFYQLATNIYEKMNDPAGAERMRKKYLLLMGL